MSSNSNYSLGSLRYNLPQLLLVGTCMLLSTQALALLANHLVPSLSPLLLDRCGASSTDIALVVGTLPYIMNFILNPIISTTSDKTRSRYGRRIPYLILSAPVMALLLIAISWSPELANLLHKWFPSQSVTTMQIYCLGTLIVLFQIAYMFPGTIVYYLIADVIPRECIGTYMAISSFCGTGLTFLFNYFVLKLAVDHTKLMFCIIGGLYLLVYILQFFFVKEGQYPPVADKISPEGNHVSRFSKHVVLFFKQCFRHKIFVFMFISVGLNQASTICRSMFNILFATKEIQMTAAQYGQVIAFGALGSALVVLPMGKIMDKTHPMFVYLIGGIIVIITNIFGYFFVHSVKSFYVVGIAMSVVYTIQNLAWTPLGIALLPKDKYGQFCSAQGMVISTIMVVASLLGGWLIGKFGYRVIFVWDFCVTAIATLTLLVVVVEWVRFGGRKGYKPPETD